MLGLATLNNTFENTDETENTALLGFGDDLDHTFVGSVACKWPLASRPYTIYMHVSRFMNSGVGGTFGSEMFTFVHTFCSRVTAVGHRQAWRTDAALVLPMLHPLTMACSLYSPSLALPNMAASAPALVTSLLADTELLPNGSTGALPSDLIYVVGVVGVLVLGGLQVFDSTFAENSETFVPPMPGSASGLRGLPVVGGFLSSMLGAPDNPEEACEALRQRLQEAAEAGDLDTAFKLEKELKQLLADTGVRYLVDEPSEQTEALPDNW